MQTAHQRREPACFKTIAATSNEAFALKKQPQMRLLIFAAMAFFWILGCIFLTKCKDGANHFIRISQENNVGELYVLVDV